MAALGASETAFWSPYGAQIDARSVACTPFSDSFEEEFCELRLYGVLRSSARRRTSRPGPMRAPANHKVTCAERLPPALMLGELPP
jgi:hypothetical protein